MACSSVSSCFGRRQPRAWASLPAFAVLLVVAVCYTASLKAQQAEEAMTPVAHIARNRALIKDAAQLKLNPVQVGGLWAQIASDYQDLGEFAEAEDAYTHSLGLLEPQKSARMAYAVTLSNLGSLYTMTQRFDAAENCNKRSLAAMEELGDPLMIARAQGHLAEVYLAMGRNKDAVRYSSLAMQAVTTLPNATNDDKGSMLITYAYASCLTSHCDEGLRAAKEAMRIVNATFAPESFPSGQAHVALGFVENRAGERDAADNDLREGVRILRLQLPPTHPLMVHALELYREYLADNHRAPEAQKIADEQMAIYEHDRNCTRCTVSVNGLRGR
jgi:tetratricopeptide (TPR) repeat protein